VSISTLTVLEMALIYPSYITRLANH